MQLLRNSNAYSKVAVAFQGNTDTPKETRDDELFLSAIGTLAKGQRGKQLRSHTALPAV
jgi:hypothetical protein